MGNIVMSTKKTAAAYKNIMIVLSIISMILGILSIAFYSVAIERTSNKGVIILLILAVFFIVEGIITFVKNYISGLTYVDVYKDRFIGRGIQNLSVLNFNIKNEEINNISIAKGFWLHIQTNSGTYKVMTNDKTAAKIFNYYIGLKG